MTTRRLVAVLLAAICGVASAGSALAEPAPRASAGPSRGLDRGDLEVVRDLCGGPTSDPSNPRCVVRRICPREPLTVRGVHRGSFSSRETHEAIVHYEDPCAVHAQNYGGAALLRRTEGRWDVVSVLDQGLMNGGCTAFVGTAPAGDFLACDDTYLTNDAASLWGLHLVTVERDEIRTTTLAGVDNPPVFPSRCPAGFSSTHELARIESSDVDGDGRRDLRITLTNRVSSAANDCRRTAADGAGWAVHTECERTVQLEFTNTGTRLTPTPATVATLDGIEKGASCIDEREGLWLLMSAPWPCPSLRPESCFRINAAKAPGRPTTKWTRLGAFGSAEPCATERDHQAAHSPVPLHPDSYQCVRASELRDARAR